MDTFVYCPNILQLLVLWTVRKNKWKTISEIDCSAAHHDYWCRVLGWGPPFLLSWLSKRNWNSDKSILILKTIGRNYFLLIIVAELMSHATVGGASFCSVSPHLPNSQQYSDDWLFFFGDVGDCTQVCYSYGYLNGGNFRGAFDDS
jgi:hypothetical protein